MFIYVIVCSETLKIYIGQHKGSNLRQYLQQKLSEARRGISTRSYLYASMRKHPRESWSIHSLVSDIENRQELDALEQHYIQALNSRHPAVGYNICRGGEGFTGPHTEEWRKETLERVNAYWASPENRAQRSQEMKEIWAASSERRQIQSEKMQGNQWNAGRVPSAEQRQKQSLGMQGKQNRLGQKQSPEELAKKSASLKKHYQEHPKGPWSAELRAKLSGPTRIVSEETRRKQSEAAQRRAQTPEGKAHLQRAGHQSQIHQQ